MRCGEGKHCVEDNTKQRNGRLETSIKNWGTTEKGRGTETVHSTSKQIWCKRMWLQKFISSKSEVSAQVTRLSFRRTGVAQGCFLLLSPSNADQMAGNGWSVFIHLIVLDVHSQTAGSCWGPLANGFSMLPEWLRVQCSETPFFLTSFSLPPLKLFIYRAMFPP